MSDIKEFWGIMNILDNADDVGIFVVSGRDGKLLYCNHLVTVLTNGHMGSHVSEVWDIEDYKKASARCNEGGTYRYRAERSRFGKRKNVTVSKVVWSKGILAYCFLITPQADAQGESEREKIFNLLGRSYRHIFLIDKYSGEVTTLLKPTWRDAEGNYQTVYYHPVHFDEWKRDLVQVHSHPDDAKMIEMFLEMPKVIDALEHDEYVFQYRRKNGSEYIWSEMRFLQPEELEGRIVCTERDADREMSPGSRDRQSEIVLRTLGNVYRSIYLVDMKTSEYSTVKRDAFLFGIPEAGDYDTLTDIALELIPDEGQRADYQNCFSALALAAAFAEGAPNVSKEYMSALNEQVSWMAVTAFETPCMQGMEDKCVLTFMDITAQKRVEAERNEKNIVVDALSSRYIGVYFVNLTDDSFHSIATPQEFRYIEKQFASAGDAIEHYAKAYVLERFREDFRAQMSRKSLLQRQEDQSERVLFYQSVDDRRMRLHIYPVPQEHGFKEVILAFEDCTDMTGLREE